MAQKNEIWYRYGDNTPWIITNIDGDMITFNTGARCSVKTLNEQFSMTPNMTAPVTESAVVTEHSELGLDYEIGMSEVYKNMLANVQSGNGTERELGNIPHTESIVSDPSYQPDANVRTIAVEQQQPPVPPTVQPPVVTQVRHAEPAVTQQPQPVQNPEIEIFKRVKATEKVKIAIEIDVMLPKADKMLLLNDMFQKSIVDYYAEEFLFRMGSGTIDVKSAIVNKLDEYMNNKKPADAPKKTVRKATPRKTTTKKAPIRKKANAGAESTEKTDG